MPRRSRRRPQTLVPPIVTPTRRKTVVEEDPFAPTGIRAGAFTFYPAVELMGGLDTNPAHVPNGKDSFLFTVAPELRVRSDWERHALNADIKGSYLAYRRSAPTTTARSPASPIRSTGRASIRASTAASMSPARATSTWRAAC